MPLPAIAAIGWAIFEIVVEAVAIYEMYEVLADLYEGLEQYKKGIEKAKEELRQVLDKLKQEIEGKIEEKEEVAILVGMSALDPQGQHTRPAQGRGATDPVIKGAIEQKIPFRKVIGLVCDKAHKMPVLNLRRKKGVTIKDLPKAKRKVLEALLGKAFEEITEMDLEQFIVVRLKQLAASLMFEFVDYCLDWKSPMKAEVSFGPPPTFDDPPVEQGTKLVRKGTVNPFYPAPHRQKGSIAADLVITDYRKHPCGKANIFAIVEIKFEGDRIDRPQFDAYNLLLRRAAMVKTERAPIRLDNKAVSQGGRLSLFRYPEDMPRHEDAQQRDEGKHQTGKHPTRRKRGGGG